MAGNANKVGKLRLTTQGSGHARRMTSSEGAHLESGAFVEVRNHFDGAWCPGFQVERALEDGYVVRRCRDGALIPGAFGLAAVRAPRRPD